MHADSIRNHTIKCAQFKQYIDKYILVLIHNQTHTYSMAIQMVRRLHAFFSQYRKFNVTIIWFFGLALSYNQTNRYIYIYTMWILYRLRVFFSFIHFSFSFDSFNCVLLCSYAFELIFSSLSYSIYLIVWMYVVCTLYMLARGSIYSIRKILIYSFVDEH